MGFLRADSFALRVAVAAAACSAASGLTMARLRREGGMMETSSTLAWVESGGGVPHHAVQVNPDDPATVWCRAQKHAQWLAGAMHAGTCTVPFIGNVLHIDDAFDVLVSINGSARVRYEAWDRYLAPPHNAISSESQRFLAVRDGHDGTPQAGFLIPRERRAHLVMGSTVERVDVARVLVEDEPLRYDLRGITLDAARTHVRNEDVVLAQAKLINYGPSRQHVVEGREVSVSQMSYWGTIKGTYSGLKATVVSPPPALEERNLTWGVQNLLKSVYKELLEYDLPPGTGVKAQLVGTERKTEAPYSGTLTAVYEDGSRTWRVVQGLHMDRRLVELHARYSSPYFLANDTTLDIPEMRTVLYRSTTTTTTTSTSTTSTTTPVPPRMSMVGPHKPQSDSLSTTADLEAQHPPASAAAPLPLPPASTSLLLLAFLALPRP